MRFSDIFVIIFFFIIFSLSQRPSSLRKPGKGLIFTPKCLHGQWKCASSPSNHSFLALRNNKKSRVFVTERHHFTTATPSAHALCQFLLKNSHTCCGQSPFFIFAASVCLKCNPIPPCFSLRVLLFHSCLWQVQFIFCKIVYVLQ